MVLLSVGCSSGKKSPVIGVSQCSNDIWRDKLNEELRVAGHFYGVDVRFSSADDDSQVQMQQIRQFVRDGVDLLIVSPNQTQSITTAVEEAFDAGIPVILFDRKINSDKYTAFMGADNTEVGRVMGRYIADYLGGKGRGLAFIDHILMRHTDLNDYPGAHVRIPKTVVLCTDIFDEFMDTNELYQIALSDLPDETILQHFLRAHATVGRPGSLPVCSKYAYCHP